ncbi:MAG: putative damage-inducible protein DinB [Flavobacteriales bacterium]|jgi:uncharacterized damage-inducible protein DinB
MSYFDKYISLSTSQDIEQTMVESHNHLIQTILPLTEEQMLFKYEENKWSIKDLLQHLIDTERVFMYRAMCFARNDKSELPGFDENEFAAEAMADLKSKGQLLNEYIAVHKSTIMFYNTLPNEAMDRKGRASGNEFTIKSIAHIIAGHIQHHLSVIEERYLPNL